MSNFLIVYFTASILTGLYVGYVSRTEFKKNFWISFLQGFVATPFIIGQCIYNLLNE